MTDVGFDRRDWERVRGELSADGMTYSGIGSEVKCTITKSELYNGKEMSRLMKIVLHRL